MFDGWIPTGKVWWDTKGRMRSGRIAPEHLTPSHAGGYQLLLNPEHPGMFDALEEHFECWHSTMWQEKVYEFVAVAEYGHEWPYIPFDAYQREIRDEYGYQATPRTGNGVTTYKWPGLMDTIGDRPVVYVDDDLLPAQHEWAQKRTEAGIPTLFIQPDPEFGMTREHFEQILEFAESLKVDSMAS